MEKEKTKVEKIATRESFGRALEELGMENKKVVVLDADLYNSTKTEYFKEKYPDRFINLYRPRKNKLLAIGTSSTVEGSKDYNLYREYFKTDLVQPLRQEIMEKAEKYPEEIESYISFIYEDKKKINAGDNLVIKFYKKIYNRHKPWTQSRYTSFDMVEKFNEYLFFICPEELVGMPGIGFVEGMACGTLYIGLDTSYYRKLGLIPGYNYISYDGTIKNLIEKVQYCQNNTDEMKMIACRGEKWVRENFNSNIVAERFFNQLKELTYK